MLHRTSHIRIDQDALEPNNGVIRKHYLDQWDRDRPHKAREE